MVIVGQLDDNPGTAIDNAIEMVAAAVETTVFSNGREFRLITYHTFGGPPYMEVEFSHRSLREDPADPTHYAGRHVRIADRGHVISDTAGDAKVGDFRDPAWRRINDIDVLLGCDVRSWPRGEYTASNLFGDEGRRLREDVARRAHAAAERVSEFL